jgi:hypothetical protein
VTVYVVVDIGCIECNAKSRVLGIYLTREEAENKHEIRAYDVRTYFDAEHRAVKVFEAECPVEDQ